MKLVLLLSIIAGICLCQDKPPGLPWVEHFTAFTDSEIKNVDGWVVRKNFKNNLLTKCGKLTLVGGHAAFGKGTTVLKTLTVPPHYKLKINVQLYKVNQWDSETIFVLVDGFIWQTKWHHTDDTKLCGEGSKLNEAMYDVEVIVPHNNPTANIIITSNIDQDAEKESWGFRNFKVSFLRCPEQCGTCSNDKAEDCFFWHPIAKSWTKDLALEGWKVDGEGKGEKTDCSGVELFGGYGKIGRKTDLWKVFDKLPPHFAVLVKVQMWKIDSWDNEIFKILVDGNERFKQAFAYNEGVDLCGADTQAKQGENWAEKIVNIEITVPHKIAEVKLLMTSSLDEDPLNESWGVRDFYIYAGLCNRGCEACTGPTKADCTVCTQGFTLTNGECKEETNWFIATKMFFDNDKDFMGNQDWVVTGSAADTQPISVCGTNKLFGGYNKFGAKAVAYKLFKLPQHRRIRVKFTLYKIDSWDDEWFHLFVDGKKVYEKQFGFNSPGQSKLCGSPQATWLSATVPVDIQLDHESTDLKVLLTSSLDEAPDNESWGFREFILMYEAVDDCVTFYSECNYKGSKYEICKDQPSLATQKITQVKSIKIPAGLVVQGFNEENYKGKTVKFSTSQECLSDITFSFIQQGYTVLQAEDSTLVANLRRVRFDN